MALVLQTLRPRRPKANDGRDESATGTSLWGVLACSASTGGQIRVESEELLGKKVLESQCSPEVFDPNTRSELLQALVDSANAARDASGTTEITGRGLGAGPAAVQVHTMGENLAVIAPVNYVLGGTPSFDLAERCQRLLDSAVGGSGAASSLEQVAVDKARALTGYDRVLYCRCLALPAFEFDVVEVLAESASEDFRSQSAADSMVGQTALLREIVDGVVVEGESRNGGSLSGKLVVPVFRRLPFQPLSLEGLLICHRYGFPSSQSTVMSREARMELDVLAETLSANPDDVYFWYASRAINGSLRVLRKCVRPDSVSLLVQYSGHSWQGKAWGTAAVQPGESVTFADLLVEAYNSSSDAVKELMPKDSTALCPSVLHESSPVIRLDVSSEAPEPAKTPRRQVAAPKEIPQPQISHRHISNIKVLRETTNSTSVSLLIEGRSHNLTAKAWGTAYFSDYPDQDDAYLEAYDNASATLKELLPPPQEVTFLDELASVCISTSSPQISLLPLVDISSASRRSSSSASSRRASDCLVENKEVETSKKSQGSISMPAVPASGVASGCSDTDGRRLRCKNDGAGTKTKESSSGDVEGGSGSLRSSHDLGHYGPGSKTMSHFRSLFKQLVHSPYKPSSPEPAAQPAAPVAQSEKDPSLKSLEMILVVDDDLVNVKMIQRILKKNGLQSLGKEDGQDIIDLCLCNGQRFDMILVDENMQYMNGSVAIEHLRRHEEMMGLEPTPVIVTTANTSSQDLTRYNECGMDGVLAKPINMRKLPMSLEAYFTHLQASTEKTAEQPTETCNATRDTQMFHELMIWKKVDNNKNCCANVSA